MVLVVLFHAEIFFTGGYIGVDVFFVLSGFVIAQVLLRELTKTGKVDLRRFYEKRFRRLLPAAAVVSVFTLLLSVVLLSPTGAQQFAIRTAMAASLFTSNLYLYRGGGYFDPNLETNPFLHMWSLSVEEQFYFVLPMTMAFVWAWVMARRRKKGSLLRARPVITGVVLFGGTLSFSLSVLLVSHPELFFFRPDEFGFFFPFTRIWEFAAGVLLALGASRLPRLGNKMALWWGIAGAAFILGAAVVYDGNTAFPGWAALFPVMGTVLLLVAGDNSDVVARTLSVKPLRWMGDISYSWYLWHWPLIVFAPVVFPDAGPWLLPVVGAASLVPAWLSYQYLEEPIRRNRAIKGRKAWGLAVACTASVFLLGAVLNAGASKHWGLAVPSGWSDLPIAHALPCDGLSDAWSRQDCTFPASESEPSAKGTILLLGDSHAASLSDGVIDAAHHEGYDVIVWWMPRCPFLKERSIFGYRDCTTWQESMLEFIQEERPALVIMSAYASNYVLSPHHDAHRVLDNGAGGGVQTHTEALDSWASGLANVLTSVEEMEIPVIAASPVPYFKRDFTLWMSLFRPEPEIPSFTRDEVRIRQKAITKTNREVIERFSNATLFDPIDYICAEKSCSAVVDDTWLYMDHTHLNAAGSRQLAPGFKQAIREVLEADMADQGLSVDP